MKATAPALEAIYLEHRAFLRSVVKGAGVPDKDADDVVHDTIASLQAAGEDCAPERSKLETWLYAAARNHAYKYFRQVKLHNRRKERAASLLDRVDVEVSSGLDPEEEVLCREGRRILDAVLARMPQLRRDVFECRYIWELPWAEITELLGISENTAMSHYEDALREVKAAYVRWAAGKAYALPFPLFLALSLDERGAPAGARFDAANDVDERDASSLADASHLSHAPALAMPGAHAPSSGVRRADHPSERSGVGALLRGVWRSRLTHELLGAAAAVVAMLFLHPFTTPGAPPPVPPPPSGEERPRPSSFDPTSTNALPPSLPAGASSLAPGAFAASPAPSAPSFARMPPNDPDAVDRDLLNAAFVAHSKGHREEALELLRRHARQFPNSKRSAQRAMLIAQLSN